MTSAECRRPRCGRLARAHARAHERTFAPGACASDACVCVRVLSVTGGIERAATGRRDTRPYTLTAAHLLLSMSAGRQLGSHSDPAARCAIREARSHPRPHTA